MNHDEMKFHQLCQFLSIDRAEFMRLQQCLPRILAPKSVTKFNSASSEESADFQSITAKLRIENENGNNGQVQ